MMQTWFIAVTLKTWQVKTIRPAGWSEEDGEGMEVAAESGFSTFVVGEATGVNKLNAGVVTTSVTAGEANPDGVEACRVANRSELGAVVGLRTPQPRMKNSAAVIHNNLFFFLLQFN